MRRIGTIIELRAEVGAARRAGERVALVPTMGALHDGHLELVRQARFHAGCVVVSVFVNPLQFGEGEDLAAYPRDLSSDERSLATLGASAPDLVYAPSVGEVYPRGAVATTVSVAGPTEPLEGAARPGHFDGVTTVVAKLLNQVAPDVAVFGRKDFQQLQVVRRMVEDLDIPVHLVAVPTVREPDGLAMSSRNAYLSPDERRAATCLVRGLAAAVEAAQQARAGGDRPPASVLLDAALTTIASEPLARVDYVAVADPDTLVPLDLATRRGGEEAGEDTLVRGAATAGDADAPVRLLVAVAVHIGPARLIDNVVIGDEQDEQRLLAAVG